PGEGGCGLPLQPGREGGGAVVDGGRALRELVVGLDELELDEERVRRLVDDADRRESADAGDLLADVGETGAGAGAADGGRLHLPRPPVLELVADVGAERRGAPLPRRGPPPPPTPPTSGIGFFTVGGSRRPRLPPRAESGSSRSGAPAAPDSPHERNRV